MDEAGLVQQARAGDDFAFDSLVGPLVDPAFKLAVVLLRDPNEAQDAVQEACLKAWKNLGRLRRDASLRPWFLSIVANQCRSMRRTRWWSVIRLDSIVRPTSPDEDRELKLDLDRNLSDLPANDRAALFLYFYMDLPLAEVARILDISPQAAKSRVHRGVTRLRLTMAEEAK